jgi:hypothetical protein
MSALDKQVGGTHYKDMKIQPMEYVLENGIGAAEYAVIKYVSRWRNKNGIDDLKKAIHYLEILIEHETGRKNQAGSEAGQAFQEIDRYL